MQIKIKQYIQLSKFIVSLSVTFTAITGYVCATHEISTQLLFLSIGVFLLSAGASALNQLQEKKLDAKMLRTQHRPLANLKITETNAIVFIISCITLGSFILSIYTSILTTLLGIFNILWYNGLYTPLKRKTAFAIIPGAVCGVIPILMGWFATQHSSAFENILFISIFMFIWQIPHFWLLLIRYETDYKKAGFPVITSLLNKTKLKYILFSWVIMCIAYTQMILIFGFIKNPYLLLFVFISTIILSTYFILQLLINRQETKYKSLFILLNILQVICMTSLIIDSLI